jgi:CCR4-NOT transcription complex subunit 1
VRAKELRELLHHHDEHLNYLAQHIALRICQEHNLHLLYKSLIEKMNLPLLSQLILTHTLNAIEMSLASPEKLKSDISERSALKHLGGWLGLLTLAQNKPLHHRDLNPKALLLRAYKQGTMPALVPFVAKILEACMLSKAFRPPNPWVMAIMQLMAEIYHLPNTKLNMKFEIELLCNNLQLDLNKLKPSALLPHNKRTDTATPQPPVCVDFANLPTFITYNPNIALFAHQPNLKRVVPVAIDRAIREVLNPVAERYVNVSVAVTKGLVQKDFATEPDAHKMRRAAYAMVKYLSGNPSFQSFFLLPFNPNFKCRPFCCSSLQRTSQSSHGRQLAPLACCQ